jgi:hypothetical protein
VSYFELRHVQGQIVENADFERDLGRRIFGESGWEALLQPSNSHHHRVDAFDICRWPRVCNHRFFFTWIRRAGALDLAGSETCSLNPASCSNPITPIQTKRRGIVPAERCRGFDACARFEVSEAPERPPAAAV